MVEKELIPAGTARSAMLQKQGISLVFAGKRRNALGGLFFPTEGRFPMPNGRRCKALVVRQHHGAPCA